MDVWTSQSNPGRQTLVSVVCAIVGVALLIGFRNFGSPNSNAFAGFLLGVLLLIIGIPGLVVSGRQSVLVDPSTRTISIVDVNRFRTKKRVIPFSDVISVSIGALGKRSNYVMQYYLVLKLTSGETYPLFAPGLFYKGSSDRAVVAGWKQRLEGYLGV
jgi:hypothetical protein